MSWSVGRPFGFPLQLHSSALVLLLLLIFAEGGGTSGILYGLVLTGVVLVSVLVHELGHAFAARQYELGPVSIVLHGFGGLTRFGRRPSHRQGVVVGLAGPVAGLCLGLFTLVGVWVLEGASPGLAPALNQGVFGQALRWLVRVNLFWSVFNLLPMYPLDGGQVLWHVLAERLSVNQARTWVRRCSLTLALVVGLLALAANAYILVLITFFIWRQNKPQ